MLALLAGITALVGGIVASIRMERFVPLPPALLLAAGLGYFCAMALHPKLVNVDVGEGTAGEEATGLLAFLLKSGLKMVPLFFLLLAVFGDLAILVSFSPTGAAFSNEISAGLQVVPIPMNLSGGFAGTAVVFGAALLPLVSYFVFLLLYLVIDLIRAVLCVPAKLDALKH